MNLLNIKKRITTLESYRHHETRGTLSDRIAHYVAIMDSEDYSSEDGRKVKAAIDKYGTILEEMGGFEDELN